MNLLSLSNLTIVILESCLQRTRILRRAPPRSAVPAFHSVAAIEHRGALGNGMSNFGISSRKKELRETAVKKEAARMKAETEAAKAEDGLQLSAALRIQCAIRQMLSKRTLYELRRPRTSQEILAERKIIFLENRRAARSAGYGMQILRQAGVSQRALDAHRRRTREEREQRAAEATDRDLSAVAIVTVYAERDQVASRLRALSRRQRTESKLQRAASESFRKANSGKVDEAKQPEEDSTSAPAPQTVTAVGGRQRRISKDLMAMARRAARISHDAIKLLSA